MKPVRTHGHRHTAPGQHEHEYEPQYGLPEVLPADEKLLWQGAPDWRSLAVRHFHVRKLVIYFAVLLVARAVSLQGDGLGLLGAVKGTLPMLALAVIAVGLVTLIAWFTARTTVYTLTDKRVVMRIGIVLTLSLNLPLRRVEAAELKLHPGADGDISLRLLRPDHMAYLHLWPHARAWRVARPEPTLLCVPKAQSVSDRLTTAWQAINGPGSTSRVADAAPAPASAGSAPTCAAH